MKNDQFEELMLTLRSINLKLNILTSVTVQEAGLGVKDVKLIVDALLEEDENDG